MELEPGAGLYRIGGDEFVVLMNAGKADTLDEHIDVAVLAARQVAPLGGVGAGVAHRHEAEEEALLSLADTRMYAVKARYRALRHP